MRIRGLFGLAVLAIALLGIGNEGPVGLAQSCSITLSPPSSLLQAVEQVSPGAVICLGVRGVPCVPPARTAGSFNLIGTFFTNEAMKNFTTWVKALRDEKAVKDELKNKTKIGALLPAWKDNKRQAFFACFDTLAKPGDFNKCTSTERITESVAGSIVCQLFDLKLEKNGECKPKPIDWSKL